MGMDLEIIAKRKDNNEEIVELCYARKFWGLWYEFFDCPQVYANPYEKYLTRESWQRFVNNMEENIELIRAANSFYDLKKLTSEQQGVIDRYEDWYGDTFEHTPILGYDFDAESLIRWYENKDEVWKYLYNNDYHVIIINSF